jgi:cytochrome P450
MPLALLEMKVVLSTILSSWELELKNPNAVRPLRRSVAIRPSDGTTMLVRGRRTDG